jgi:hypothetical protein
MEREYHTSKQLADQEDGVLLLNIMIEGNQYI